MVPLQTKIRILKVYNIEGISSYAKVI
jgi:hypothetical protein